MEIMLKNTKFQYSSRPLVEPFTAERSKKNSISGKELVSVGNYGITTQIRKDPTRERGGKFITHKKRHRSFRLDKKIWQ